LDGHFMKRRKLIGDVIFVLVIKRVVRLVRRLFSHAQTLANVKDSRYPKTLLVKDHRTSLEDLLCQGVPETMTFVLRSEVDARQAP